MKLSLVVLSEGKSKGQALAVNLPQFLIGRDPQCQLRPASPMISKRHCAVLLRNGKAFVRDFDSTNGTFVNDEPVKGERELKNEDTLKVGPLLFRVALEGTPPVNKPTPPPSKLQSPPPSEDDDVAAMLLSLQDEGSVASPKAPDAVPEGSTVMDTPSPLSTEKSPEAEQKKPEDKKEPPKKKEEISTASLAADILKRYTNRQRT